MSPFGGELRNRDMELTQRRVGDEDLVIGDSQHGDTMIGQGTSADDCQGQAGGTELVKTVEAAKFTMQSLRSILSVEGIAEIPREGSDDGRR